MFNVSDPGIELSDGVCDSEKVLPGLGLGLGLLLGFESHKCFGNRILGLQLVLMLALETLLWDFGTF